MSDLRQKVVNNFLGGMNKDADDAYIKENQYRHAENFRILSDKESQFGSLNNIKGNINSVDKSLLRTSKVYSYKQEDYTTQNYTVTVSHGGLAPITIIFNVLEYNIRSAYENLAAQINTIWPELNIAYNRYWMLIYSDDINFMDFTINISSTGVDTMELLLPEYNGLQVIGSGYVRDDLIIFTCPKNNAAGSGQIWKITFDDSITVPQATLTLLYNNKLNFSTNYPIREAKGQYENTECSKIYFTDDNNYLRCFNYALSNSFALPPELIDVMGDVNLTKPLLDNITVGSLPCGNIQYAYRLYNKYGGESQLSPLSNMIHLAKGSDFGITDIDYTGDVSTVNSGKAIILKIPSIDRRYDFIKIYAIFYKDGFSTPEITEISDTNVETDDMYITDTGKSIISAISQDEFDVFSKVLFKCKTMDIKNNLLVVGNTSGETFNVDYDARAYRFDNTPGFPIAKVYDKEGNSINITTLFQANNQDVPETHDCINQDQDTYKYQSNGQILGGSGPNIEYAIKCLQLSSHYSDLSDNEHLGIPEKSAHQQYNIWSGTDDLVDNKSSFCGYSSPFNSGQFRTYMRGETYRLGIVFYSKKGLRSPAKWIGDIKMPEIIETVGWPGYPNGLYTKLNGSHVFDFRTFYFNEEFPATPGLKGNVVIIPLYLDFSVNIPASISDEVAGFEIVRVKRNGSDKTVVAQGVLGSVGKTDQNNPSNYTELSMLTSTAYDAIYLYKNYNVANFYSPEGIFDQNIKLLNDDKIGIVGTMTGKISNYDILIDGQTPVHRYYNEAYNNWVMPPSAISTPNQVYDCQFANINVSKKFRVTTSAGISEYQNFEGNGNAFGGAVQGVGGPNNVVGINNNPTGISSRGILANYYRTQTKQYGGNSYDEKTLNRYITTGRFKQVTGPGLFTNVLVFGGDTFISYFDTQSLIWNIANEVNGSNGGTAITYGRSILFPVESELNLSLRKDKGYYKTLNYRLQGKAGSYYISASGSTGAIYTQDDDLYQYNPAYSRQPDVQEYLAENKRVYEQKEFDCRIRASKRKTNGEYTDSWSSFLTLTYLDINTNLGELNKLINFKNVVYGIQNNGFGVASIDDRSIVQGTDASSIVLGNGSVLPRYDYISMTAGTKHQLGVVCSDSALYFFDANDRQLKIFTGESKSLSDEYVIKSYLYNNVDGNTLLEDNPHNDYGINSYYDDRYNEVIFTFHKGTSYNQNGLGVKQYFTLAFNEMLKSFTGFYTFQSPIYIKHYSKVLSINRLFGSSSDTIYLHNFGDYNTFYGTWYPSKIKFVINDKYGIQKVFDSLLMEFESTENDVNVLEDFFTYVRCFNNYQNTDWHELVFNTTPAVGKQINYDRRERIYSFQFPRNIVDQTVGSNPDIFNALFLTNVNREFRERLRDKALNIELTYDNPGNKKIKVQLLTTNYRISAR